MKFRVMSDLHFEFHVDGGREFVASLDVEPDEVLLCAGDVCSSPCLIGALSLLCRRFSRVVYVMGNHELYHSRRESVARAIDMARANFPGTFHALDKDAVEIDGVRVLGCPLWFAKDARAPREAMNDFRMIRDFDAWVYDENARCVEFLRRELRTGDVVLTHHLPSLRSVAPRWRGSPLNAFFVCDVEPLIRDRQPALWVHGHTHDSMDYQIGATRVLCNPFGYAHHEENPTFNATMRVRVERPSAAVATPPTSSATLVR